MSNDGSGSGGSYSVLLLPRAERDLGQLPEKEIRRLRARLDGLRANPRPYQTVKLVGGTNQYRLRAGDYRVLYAINDKENRVTIYEISHRKDAYR